MFWHSPDPYNDLGYDEKYAIEYIESRSFTSYNELRTLTEIIVQTIKKKFDNKTSQYTIYVTEQYNKVKTLVINISYTKEYTVNYIPAKSVYNDDNVTFDHAEIDITLNKRSKHLNESIIRQLLQFEFKYIAQDLERTRYTYKTLGCIYDQSIIDIEELKQDILIGNPQVKVFLDIFMENEFSKYTYMMLNDLKTLPDTKCSNAYDNIIVTNTFKEYRTNNNIDLYKYNGKVIELLSYFPKWKESYNEAMAKGYDYTDKIMQNKFMTWLHNAYRTLMSIMWIQMCKGAVMYYEQKEKSGYRYTYDKILDTIKERYIKYQSLPDKNKQEFYKKEISDILVYYLQNCPDDLNKDIIYTVNIDNKENIEITLNHLFNYYKIKTKQDKLNKSYYRNHLRFRRSIFR